MEFCVLNKSDIMPASGLDTGYLVVDNWNDYSFRTLFQLFLYDNQGARHELGDIKIAFKGQTEDIPTHDRLPQHFENLDSTFFSLGQNTKFYKELALLPIDFRISIMTALRDVVIDQTLIDNVREESVFSVSLLRFVSLATIKGQFARVLEGRPELSDFKFKFTHPGAEGFSSIDLSFEVDAGSEPSTNIHAIIGQNGVGKTTLLNNMIKAITDKQDDAKFIEMGPFRGNEIDNDYFSSLVSVSFSAFDPFQPPHEQSDPAKGTCYSYLGLKDSNNPERHRSIDDLYRDCAKALGDCFSRPDKTKRWFSAIENFGSDDNFHSMNLIELETTYRKLIKDRNNNMQRDAYYDVIQPLLCKMSSGHAIVLLTISNLVATVEERTIVLLDEPESHLHPPLLSAFVRALANLLHDRNGVAIIATHSPVVLQEIPKSCVWKIYRIGHNVICDRPTIETFGENVGLLTSEVFGLEVERSGFHALLQESVASGKTYEEIVRGYNMQLGSEGRTILRVLIAKRDMSIFRVAPQ